MISCAPVFVPMMCGKACQGISWNDFAIRKAATTYNKQVPSAALRACVISHFAPSAHFAPTCGRCVPSDFGRS